MNAVVTLVQKFPYTALTVIGLLTTTLAVTTARLRLSKLETVQIVRAAEDLKLDTQLIEQMTVHGPYYK